MAVQTVQNLPAQFVQDLGVDLAKQVTAQSGVPVVSTGIAGIHNKQVNLLQTLQQDKVLLKTLQQDNKIYQELHHR